MFIYRAKTGSFKDFASKGNSIGELLALPHPLGKEAGEITWKLPWIPHIGASCKYLEIHSVDERLLKKKIPDSIGTEIWGNPQNFPTSDQNSRY